jgi:phosphopantothenoylcysteine synthetase/decarboxylase
LILEDAAPCMLVTAGNTLARIDAVRGITNVFSGRTGARIAAHATMNGYDVELLTSRPDAVEDAVVDRSRLTLTEYQTFDELASLMESRIRKDRFHVIVHAAAVSDYQCAGVYEPRQRGADDARELHSWSGALDAVDATEKISSRHSELWIRLTPTRKLVDQIRRPWGFTGVLVKFKLEVGVSDDELARRAEGARRESDADLVVANSLESVRERAMFVRGDAVEKVDRANLAARLIAAIDVLRRGRAAAFLKGDP